MNVIAVGTDIVKTARFRRITPRFAARVFTPGEWAYLGISGTEIHTLSPCRQQRAAGLFAAKEAVAKALGTGFSGFWPCDIEIGHTPAGAPRVRLHGRAARRVRGSAYRRRRVCVSISHTTDEALAFAVVWG